jgi:hypothetical protein
MHVVMALQVLHVHVLYLGIGIATFTGTYAHGDDSGYFQFNRKDVHVGLQSLSFSKCTGINPIDL